MFLTKRKTMQQFFLDLFSNWNCHAARIFCHHENPDISWLLRLDMSLAKAWSSVGCSTICGRSATAAIDRWGDDFVFVARKPSSMFQEMVEGCWGFGFPSYLLSLLFERDWGEGQLLFSSALPTVTVEVGHPLVHIIGSKQRHNKSRASSWKDVISVVHNSVICISSIFIMQYNPSNRVVYSIIFMHNTDISYHTNICMTHVVHACMLRPHSMLDRLYVHR